MQNLNLKINFVVILHICNCYKISSWRRFVGGTTMELVLNSRV